MSDLLDKKRRLADMLKEAAALATECGINGEGWQTKSVPESIAADEQRVRASIAFDERAALPIAIGDTVQMYDENGKRRTGSNLSGITLNKVGRTLVHTDHDVFRVSDGKANDGCGHRHIIAEDMIRIRRDLMKGGVR